LVSALAISFLLHALLLGQTAWTRPDAAGQPALLATLRAAAASAPPAPHPTTVPRHDPQPPPAAAVPEPVATLTPPVPSALVASTPGVTLRSSPSPESAGAAAAAAGVAAASAGPAAGEGLDPEGVRRYRLALAAQVRRFKRYPPQALEADIGGTAEIRIAVAADGVPGEVLLGRSSGSGLLDDAALDWVKRAVPRTAVPEPLRGRAFVVSLSVVFDAASE
jgi:protein TonB